MGFMAVKGGLEGNSWLPMRYMTAQAPLALQYMAALRVKGMLYSLQCHQINERALLMGEQNKRYEQQSVQPVVEDKSAN